jgi:hypothetical protein
MSIGINSPRAREQRAAKYRKAVTDLASAEARLASNPNDGAATLAVQSAGIALNLAEAALRHCGDPIPQSAPPAVAATPSKTAGPSSPSGRVANPGPSVSAEVGGAPPPPPPAPDPEAEMDALAKRIAGA